jgi:hypothetical protein
MGGKDRGFVNDVAYSENLGPQPGHSLDLPVQAFFGENRMFP